MKRKTKDAFEVTEAKAMVGVEAEFFILNEKGEAIVVPPFLPRDGFPILGEVRGAPGKDIAETISNFWAEYYNVRTRIDSKHTMAMKNIMRIRLKKYQEAMKRMNQPKNEYIGDTRNIYGVDIDSFSDQVLKGGKIQGINASCGLHIHFSLVNEATTRIRSQRLESIELPIFPQTSTLREKTPEDRVVEEVMRPYIILYRLIDDEEEEEVIKATANLLTRPVAEWIVKHMDDKFFEKFAPVKEERTKFRQAGFYRRKNYGLEYRSLPANAKTMEALPEIVEEAFSLLKRVASDV
jgi:hypothetical protein